VYRHVLTTGVPTDGVVPICRCELLEAFRGRRVELIRESVRLVMQELIETEVSQKTDGDRYERTESRGTDRNGSRPRLLSTQEGDAQLKIRSCARARSTR
jgi:hypothetical protein